jgi:hypothetical protein
MTRAEWQALSHLAFAEWWDAPQDEDRCEAWYGVLAPFDYSAVQLALRRLLRESPRFAPRLGELVVQLEPRPPSFDEIWLHLERLLGRYHADDLQGGLRAVSAELGVDVAGWAAAYGWARLCVEQVGDPEHGGAVLHRLRASYEETAGDEPARARLAAALERELTGVAVRSVNRELHRLATPIAALPQGGTDP